MVDDIGIVVVPGERVGREEDGDQWEDQNQEEDKDQETRAPSWNEGVRESSLSSPPARRTGKTRAKLYGCILGHVRRLLHSTASAMGVMAAILDR